MKITFLGTGTSQGVPVITCDCPVCSSLDFRDKRLRSSLLLEVQGKTLVIDTGPDFRQQMLQNRVQQLDAVLFTHAHKDHTAGMDDIRSFNFKQKQDMPIFATADVLKQIQREFAYVFEAIKYPGVPSVAPETIDEAPFLAAGVPITPIEVMHYKLPVKAFRIGDFTYITDANYISEKELKKVRGSKVLVVNALQRTPHISHFTLTEALALVEDLEVEQAYFTHISHKLGTHREVEAMLPPHVRLAYDGLSVSIP
ncbi:MAG: MBL fold metallo-hydrolase [Nitritalea sp.]